MVIAGTTFCWKAAEFKIILSQIWSQGTSFHHVLDQVRRVYTKSHELFITREGRIHWAIFVICCSLEITRKQDRCQNANKKRFKAFQKRLSRAYDFLHAMWKMQLFVAKVTLKCSYYFVRLLLTIRLSRRSVQEFFLSCFHVLSHSRSSISVCPTTAAVTIYQKPNSNAN